MTTHEVLVAAKGYLLTYGWHQGGFGNDGGPRCVMGAVDSICGVTAESFSAKGYNDATAAIVAFDRILPRPNMVAAWNDDDDRTFDEVIAAFDRAIIATAPKDTPAPQPETPSPSVTHVFA